MRGATSHDSRSNYRTDISTHAPHAGSDTATITARATKAHFNPHLLCGRRLVSRLDGAMSQNFNPRSPCGERHARWTSFSFRHSDFNPRSPCGERRFPCFDISLLQLFQPTLPMRGATRKPQEPVAHFLFQPTLPMRGATRLILLQEQLNQYFNPRSPCGERPSA